MSAITDDLARIGIAPTPALAAFDELEHEIRRVRIEAAPDTRQHFRELVAAGAPSGKLTAAYEAAVSAEMRARAAGAVLAEIEVPMRRGLSKALKSDADALWQLLTDRFAEVVADLAPAVALLGAHPDQGAVAEFGPAARAALRVYLTAINQLGNLKSAVHQVAAARGERTPLPMARLVDPDQLKRLVDVQRANGCDTVAELIAAGFTPKLTTATEHTVAIARVRATEDAAHTERSGAEAAPAPADQATAEQVRRIR